MTRNRHMEPQEKTESIPLIRQSPFVKDREEDVVAWSFTAPLPVGGEVSAYIHPAALFESLAKDCGDDDYLLVCGCSDAGCAHFWHEEFEKTAEWIEWRVTYYDLKCVWHYDRAVYEEGAIRMLRDIHDTREGWHFCLMWYDSFEDFKAAVEKFLSDNPRFRALWDATGAKA